MKAREIKEPGFYWWKPSKDDGPKRGRPAMVIQVGVRAFDMSMSSDECMHCFMPGDPIAWNLRELPREFVGPLQDPFA